MASALSVMFAYCLSNNTIGYFIAPVSEALGITRASFNFYFTIMSVVSLAAAPLYGQLLSRFSVRKVILAGMAAGCACFMLFSVSHHVIQFYIVAALFGLCQYGATSMTVVVMISRAFSVEKSGTAMGIAMSGTGLGNAIISLILPGLIAAAGWQTGYRLEGILWAVMMGIGFLLAPAEDRRDKRPEADKSKAGTAEGQEGYTLGQTLHMPPFYIFVAAIMVITIAMIFIHHLPAFIVELGMSEAGSGRIMSILSLCLLVGHIVIGMIADRFSANAAILTGLGTFLAGMIIMSFSAGSILLIIAGGALTSFGMSMTTVLFPIYTRKIFGSLHYS